MFKIMGTNLPSRIMWKQPLLDTSTTVDPDLEFGIAGSQILPWSKTRSSDGHMSWNSCYEKDNNYSKLQTYIQRHLNILLLFWQLIILNVTNTL